MPNKTTDSFAEDDFTEFVEAPQAKLAYKPQYDETILKPKTAAEEEVCKRLKEMAERIRNAPKAVQRESPNADH